MRLSFTPAFLVAFLSLSLLTARPALAQSPIVLTDATFPATATPERVQSLNIVGLPVPGTGANRVWDYRPATLTGAVRQQTYAPAADSVFSTATRSQTFTIQLGFIPVMARRYQQLTPQGLVELGVAIPRQVFPSGVNDSIVILAQHCVYAVPTRVQALPYTFGTPAGIATQRLMIRGELTAGAFGQHQTPMTMVRQLTVLDSVVGWGTTWIPVAGQSLGSASIPSLLRRATIIQEDSLYLNGFPAPVPFLQGVQFLQGNLSLTYRDEFLRLDSSQPVLTLDYASFTRQQVTEATVSAELNLPLGLATPAPVAELRFYPNPVTPGGLLYLPETTGRDDKAIVLHCRAADGREVAQLPVAAHQPVVLPVGLPAGLYQLTLTGSGRTLRQGRLMVTE